MGGGDAASQMAPGGWHAGGGEAAGGGGDGEAAAQMAPGGWHCGGDMDAALNEHRIFEMSLPPAAALCWYGFT